MLLSRGPSDVFITRPISATLLGVIGLVIVWKLVVFVRTLRQPKMAAATRQP